MVTAPPVPGSSALYSVAADPVGARGRPGSPTPVVLEFTGGSWQMASPPPLAQALAIAGASDKVWTVQAQLIAHGVPG